MSKKDLSRTYPIIPYIGVNRNNPEGRLSIGFCHETAGPCRRTNVLNAIILEGKKFKCNVGILAIRGPFGNGGFERVDLKGP